jgi:hypothetical protein
MNMTDFQTIVFSIVALYAVYSLTVVTRMLWRVEETARDVEREVRKVSELVDANLLVTREVLQRMKN